jgi:dipeptidyl aminopeptidase/acylaminoacyl peptidase
MRITAFCLAALTMAATLTAQAPESKRPMTFADLQAIKRVSDPQISPSGRWVLFSVTDVSLEKNTKTNHLWIVPIGGSQPGEDEEKQVTLGNGESNGRFSPDGKWIMYTSSDPYKGKPGSSQIWIAPWTDAAGTLGTGHPITALETEADGAIWAPDSRHFLFTSDVYPACESKSPQGSQRNEDEVNCNAQKDAEAAKSPVKAQILTHLLYRHWNQYVGEKRSHIFYAEVPADHAAPAAPEDLTPTSVIGDHVAPTFSLGGPLGYAISPDGKEIAYVVNLDKVPAESTNNDIFTLQVGAEPSTAKKVSTSPGSDDGPQYSPDGKWLAWRSQARNGYESDKFDLVLMDRASGNTRNLTTKFDGWVDEFVWLPESFSMVFTSGTHGEEDVYSIYVPAPDIPAKDVGIATLEESGGEFSDIHPFRAGLIATRMKADSPAEIYELPAHGKNNQIALTTLNDSLTSQLDLSQLESFWFAGANNTKVQGFLVKPPNFDPNKKYPLKFLIHGGPQGAWGDAWSYRWNPELFAANGYVVVMINPRGSTGYGQKFVEQVSGDWGGRPYIDLMRGLDYAEAHYPFIDKTRECALGASYGGFMADWVLTHTDRFKCIVTHDGMYNPQAAFGDTEELWFNEWEFRPLAGNGPDAVVEQAKPAHPWDFYNLPASQDPFRKWSPLLNIKNAKTPTLVVHSQRDYRLDVSEGLQLFTALQLLGVPSKMLYFPDEGHWVLKPQNSQLWYQTVNDWCDRWTGTNAYATVGPEKNPLATTSKPTKSSHSKVHN